MRPPSFPPYPGMHRPPAQQRPGLAVLLSCTTPSWLRTEQAVVLGSTVADRITLAMNHGGVDRGLSRVYTSDSREGTSFFKTLQARLAGRSALSTSLPIRTMIGSSASTS